MSNSNSDTGSQILTVTPDCRPIHPRVYFGPRNAGTYPTSPFLGHDRHT
jgi:hypothetical protein